MESLPKRIEETNKGQALLLVLLSMSVVLTVVLSVASKSATDIQVTTYEEDAYRAFNAAEAGIEEALLVGSDVADPAYAVNVSYDTKILQSSVGDEFDYPIGIKSGEVATFWFVSHDPTNLNEFSCAAGDCTRSSQIEICWGNGTPTIEPAVILSIFYDDSGNPSDVIAHNDYSNIKVYSESYDPDPASRSAANNFVDVSGSSCGFSGYNHSTGNIVLPAGLVPCATNNEGCLLLMKVKMIYNTSAQSVGIKVKGAGATLPSQGLLVSSEGVAGEVSRKVNVLQSYPVPQSPFENVIFSQNDVNK